MLNKVILMGRLTRDPELKYTPSNVAVCSFTIAVDRGYVKPGEQRQADFINIVTWRNTAEFVSRYFVKGQLINVCGSLQTRTWDDAQGIKHYATEVIADEVNFCGDNRGSGNAGQQAENQDFAGNSQQTAGSGFAPVDTDDDLPF
ncbi:MAG: single-stranded DNA-binding protein [Clostridia bacterium]|nr:single-stranded DNA-binding protein [Clostridia bacterium]